MCQAGKDEKFKMDTSKILHLGAMRKGYSDQFEQLYNRTLLESPRAKELSNGAKAGSLQNGQHWKSPSGKVPIARMPASLSKASGSTHSYMLSPAAKIIQKMKKADVQEKAAANQPLKTCTPNRQISQSMDQNQTLDDSVICLMHITNNEDVNNQNVVSPLSSFKCSDTSSDSSNISDTSTQQPCKSQTQASNVLKKLDEPQKDNLHQMIPELRSPQKQTSSKDLHGISVCRTRSKSKTSTDGEQVKRSLTPELKTARSIDMAKSPKARNHMYRNKRININKSISLPDSKRNGQLSEAVLTQLISDIGDCDDNTPGPGKAAQLQASMTEVSKQVPPTESLVVMTPSTQMCGGLKQSSTEQDDDTPKNSKMPKSQQSEETLLDSWFIQIISSGKGVRLQGHRDKDLPGSFWNSGVITQRINNTTIKTKSGSVYKIKGKIDKVMAREEGFTSKLIKQFQNGFPINWKEALSEIMHRNNKSITKVAATETPVVKTSKEHIQQSYQKAATPKDSVMCTPRNQVTVTIQELPRSNRSGRIIKPPLAYWVNQRIRNNFSTDTVEIIAGGTDYLQLSITGKSLTGSTELTPDELSRSSERSKRGLRRLKRSVSKVKEPKLSKRERPDAITNLYSDKEIDCNKPAASPITQYQSCNDQSNVCQSQKQSTKSFRKNLDSDTHASEDSSSKVDSQSETQHKHIKSSEKKKSKRKQRKKSQARLHQAEENCNPESTGDHYREPPAPPRKIRCKPSRNQSNLPKSPLYYHLSPGTTTSTDYMSTQDEAPKPVVGKTPSASHPTVAGQLQMPNNDTPITSSLKISALKNEKTAMITLSDVEKKIGQARTLRSSSLNLQQEVMSVIQTYKEKRLSKIQERHTRFNSSKKKTEIRDGYDVYDLENSENEFEQESRLVRKRSKLRLKEKSETSSNWSDVCNKTSKQTWVTRKSPAKPVPVKCLLSESESTDNFRATVITSDTTTQNEIAAVGTLSTITSSERLVQEPAPQAKRYRGRSRKKVAIGRSNMKTRSGENTSSCVDLVSNDDNETSQTTFNKLSKRTKINNCKTTANKLFRRSTRVSSLKTVAESEADNESSSTESTKLMSLRPRAKGTSRYPLRSKPPQVIVIYDSEDDSIADSSEDEFMPIAARKTMVHNNDDLRHSKAMMISKQKKNCRATKTDGIGTITSKNTVQQQKNDKGPSNKTCKEESKNIDGDINEQQWAAEELSKLKSSVVLLYFLVFVSVVRITLWARLVGAIAVVSPGTDMYWQCVASLVETKSADLCQLKHQESLEKKTKPTISKKKLDQNLQNKEPVKLTAKVGTMKRKRQLRELVEQHNQGHEGDYFDSTPFKQNKKRLKISTNFDSDEEEEGTMTFRTPGSARFKTPSVRHPWELAPLSDKKTPYTNLRSPWRGADVDRNHLDTYINGIQKKKKVRTLVPQTTPFITRKITKAKRATNIALDAHKASKQGIFDVRPVSDGSDSEKESDYYWSDEEPD